MMGLMQMMETRLPAEWAPTPAEQPSSLNITLVYDEIAAGEYAMGALAIISKNFKGELQIRPRLWRIDLLEDPEWSEQALTDGMNADILVIAIGRNGELNHSLKRWIELCFAEKRGMDAAIVALFTRGEGADTSNEAAIEFIRSEAENARLDFFAPECPRANRLNVEREDSSFRVHSDRKTLLTRAIAATKPAPYEHWGIND